jgi:DNA-binding NarL/FixJ family response regulator
VGGTQESYNCYRQTIFIINDNNEDIVNLSESLYAYYNVFYTDDCLKALEKLKEIPKPDIILSAMIMDNTDSYTFYQILLQNEDFIDIPVFFFTPVINSGEKIKILKSGIIDVIMIPFDSEEVLAKINSFLNNQRMYREQHRKMLEKKISLLLRKTGDDEFLNFERKCSLYRISPREKTIVREIFQGLQTKEIAAKFFLSIHTVKKHIRRIYKKCAVQNRVELINRFK